MISFPTIPRTGISGSQKAGHREPTRAHGGPPNNWLSRFGGSAWQWDEETEQYYYHAFLIEQPDLNWRNPEVREAMAEVLRFWLRRGVDGFRVDASALLAEVPCAGTPVLPAGLRAESPGCRWERMSPRAT